MLERLQVAKQGQQTHVLPRQMRLWQCCVASISKGWAEPESALVDWLCAAEGPDWPLPLGPACPLPGGCSIENELEAAFSALPCSRREHRNGTGLG